MAMPDSQKLPVNEETFDGEPAFYDTEPTRPNDVDMWRNFHARQNIEDIAND